MLVDATRERSATGASLERCLVILCNRRLISTDGVSYELDFQTSRSYSCCLHESFAHVWSPQCCHYLAAGQLEYVVVHHSEGGTSLHVPSGLGHHVLGILCAILSPSAASFDRKLMISSVWLSSSNAVVSRPFHDIVASVSWNIVSLIFPC